MNENLRVAILSIVTVILVITILVFICINPWVAVGLPAVLLAVAAIIRAIGGNSDDDEGKPATART